MCTSLPHTHFLLIDPITLYAASLTLIFYSKITMNVPMVNEVRCRNRPPIQCAAASALLIAAWCFVMKRQSQRALKYALLDAAKGTLSLLIVYE
ncbi:hypothetical protein D918_01828 [Trichuris suis]|nr:hypothetical protein D918_01828 [Trichuris suis]